ncbi:hypothetical protein B0H13DRAFT_2350648 [Mycena leptocephala]|nr:hypothetical protein B0H13DRAFT_2350648 [Mycena leptocephala]
MKNEGKKEGTHLPTHPCPTPLDAYSELEMDDDVPGVLGDVLTGGVLGDDALAFHTRVPSPLDADGDAGERLDFAGPRRPEIVRARVVGGDTEALVVLFLLPLPLGLEALAVRGEEALGGRRCERGGGSGAGIFALCSMPPASSCVPSPSLVQTQVKGSRSRVALTLDGEYESNQERARKAHHVPRAVRPINANRLTKYQRAWCNERAFVNPSSGSLVSSFVLALLTCSGGDTPVNSSGIMSLAEARRRYGSPIASIDQEALDAGFD